MDKFTYGNSQAAINLADIMSKRSSKEQRKIGRALCSYSTYMNNVVRSNLDYGMKHIILKQAWEKFKDDMDFMVRITDGITINDVAVTHTLNVAKIRFHEALYESEIIGDPSDGRTICWYKHGPYDDEYEPQFVTFTDPEDDGWYSELVIKV